MGFAVQLQYEMTGFEHMNEDFSDSCSAKKNLIRLVVISGYISCSLRDDF
jgi:hypothetical protein